MISNEKVQTGAEQSGVKLIAEIPLARARGISCVLNGMLSLSFRSPCGLRVEFISLLAIVTFSGNLTPPLILYNSSFFGGSARTVPFFYLVQKSYTDNLSNLDNLRNHTQTAGQIYSLCSPHTIFLGA